MKRHDALTLLHEQAATLRTSIESTWQPRTGLYHYRDRETGMSLAGKVLARQQGSGTSAIKLKFEAPVRLLIEVQSQNPHGEAPGDPHSRVFHEAGGRDCFEQRLSMAQQRANLHHTKNIFEAGEGSVKGLGDEDTVVISTLDFTSEDHTLFMPLWAGVPDEQHAQMMIGRALLDANRFYRPVRDPCLPG